MPTYNELRRAELHGRFLSESVCVNVDITWLTDTAFSAGVTLSMTTGIGPDDEETHESDYEAIGTLIRGVLTIDALGRIADEVRAELIEGLDEC